jgi:hypothetical protein
MISCSSGQIYWVYEYLRARAGAPEHLRTTFLQEIEELHRFRNINIDYSNVAFDLARTVNGGGDKAARQPVQQLLV